MQVSVENIGKLERRMQVQVPAERVSKEIAQPPEALEPHGAAEWVSARQGAAQGDPPTVRPAGAPRSHRRAAAVELRRSGHPEPAAPAGNPRIEPQSMDEGQDLTYVATFEVFPEVALQPIESLGGRALDGRGDRRRRRRHDRAAAQATDEIHRGDAGGRGGDKVTVDFEGSIDGVPFAGGKGEDVAIVLGEGRMLPELEQGLIGAAPGEQKERRRRLPGRLPRHGTRRQARQLQGRRQEGRRAVAAGAGRGILQGLRRHRRRGRRSCARTWPPTCGANSSRTCATATRPRCMEKLLSSQSHRRAERA